MPGTWALLAVLIGVHVAVAVVEWQAGFTELLDGLLFERDQRFRVSAGGQHAALINTGDAYRLWTSVLLHADGLHLLVNGVALVALGRLLEPWLGALRLLAWFFVCGVLGSLASWGAGLTMSDGASGALFGLLGVAAVLGNQERPHLVPEDARLVGPVLWGFLALNVVLSMVLPFVDGIAHLSGLLGGMTLGLVVGRRRHLLLTGLEAFWMVACTALLALGWFWPELFTANFWR